MWKWEVRLEIPDYLTPDQEEDLLDRVSVIIDAGFIENYIEELLAGTGDITVKVEE